MASCSPTPFSVLRMGTAMIGPPFIFPCAIDNLQRMTRAFVADVAPNCAVVTDLLPTNKCPLPGVGVEQFAMVLAAINSTMRLEMVLFGDYFEQRAALVNGSVDMLMFDSVADVADYELFAPLQVPTEFTKIVRFSWCCAVVQRDLQASSARIHAKSISKIRILARILQVFLVAKPQLTLLQRVFTILRTFDVFVWAGFIGITIFLVLYIILTRFLLDGKSPLVKTPTIWHYVRFVIPSELASKTVNIGHTEAIFFGRVY